MSPPSNQSIETVYRDHHRWLQAWLRGRLGCSSQAADIAQDTFVRLLTRQRDGHDRDVREPRAYLRVIAGGLVTDYFRRRSLENAYLETLAALPEPSVISPEEREILLETLHRIDAMLDRMPAGVRQAFILSQLEGLGYRRIAERMGLSERTIKRYMRQAFGQCLALML
ncbi:RNA polymerase sigma-70 factor, ECF subfamily [Alloalcanivorax dieselolei B5]|uniref:RNA polymerase sigma-70 factor, ECF subfamily n=1 Tax=Alcanivorax dieselolei (strain DSM 16502 / CGMCC 1.3690 / MCCC 1A00001 / B-5) TaxID=930169 RepID=K0C8X8_ALCDB|nr:sigma-70 family RNA polymerase sigma factor [Alloalcanivorax dieselolei]AFT69038.1 RNA polymerase sigma-70 factor, ECF subfamily [Alloalcanivorax dieselolei B5]GGJ82095.1 ECF sigma factor FemI [Alloalcanivorax dieselolei]